MIHILLLGSVLTYAAFVPPHAADALVHLSDPATATVHGVVRANASLEPLPHATVRIAELHLAVEADEKGYFVIRGVPNGRWRAEASAIGYEAHAITLIISGGSVRLDFELPVRPVLMPVLEVRTTPVGEAAAGTEPMQRVGPAALRVQSRAVRAVPGLAEPDVFRALQSLPAVGTISDFSSALYIRGGAADQTGVTLDGIPLFNPYHVGGLLSAIPVDAVAAVELWPGAAPARAMDRLSGAVQIQTRDGGRDRTRASGGVGLLSSTATVDGPIGPGTFLLSGRRTYIDAITDAAYNMKLIDWTVPYGFSDAYGKVTMPTGGLGTISLSAYHNAESLVMPDRMRHGFNGGSGPSFHWGSSMAALSWRQPVTAALLLESRVGISRFRGAFEGWEIHAATLQHCHPDGTCSPAQAAGDSVHMLSADTYNRAVVAAAEATWYRGAHTVRGGLQFDDNTFTHDVRQLDDVDSTLAAPFRVIGAPRTVAAHLEDEWRISDRLSGRLGIRALYAGKLGHAVMPRAGVHLRLTPRLSLNAGGGTYAQALRSLRNDESVISSLVAYDLIGAQPEAAGLARSRDIVAGFAFTDVATVVRAELYARRLEELVLQPRNTTPMDAPFFLADDYRIGSGSAHGLEVSAQHRHRAAEVALGYTLAVAWRDVDGQRYAPRFERRHVLDGNAVWHLNRGQLSVRTVLGTGQPFTPVAGVEHGSGHEPGVDNPGATVAMGDYNTGRLPAYARVDIAARREYSRRWFGRPVVVTPYAQVLNVLNHRNSLAGRKAAPDGTQPRPMPQFPILPSFGFEWRH